MNAIAFEIAEHERDRALTARQLAAVEFVVGMGAEREKYTAQLARIDARLAALRTTCVVHYGIDRCALPAGHTGEHICPSPAPDGAA